MEQQLLASVNQAFRLCATVNAHKFNLTLQFSREFSVQTVFCVVSV